MAACGRTQLLFSLVRRFGGRQSACCQKTPRFRTGSYFPFPVWIQNPANSVSAVNLTFSWATHHRALTTEAPHEEEYPPLPDYIPLQENNEKEVFIVRVKGLPWACGAEDLLKFFSECRIRGGVNGIHLMHNKNGKPNGQAFIELEHEEDINKALEMHRQYLGPRYIEVYEVTNRDAEAILNSTDESQSQDGVVRLRGLPFNCTEKEIMQFFSELEIVSDGVVLVTDRSGRNSGDAFVQFATQEMADEALKRDREVIGNRYIEVFPSKKSEIQIQYGRGKTNSNTITRTQRNLRLPEHYIHMRGLPYQAIPADIINFFHPLRVAKVSIEYGPDGNSSGEAQAYFLTHKDAVDAMAKDKQYIQDRYIELFLNST